ALDDAQGGDGAGPTQPLAGWDFRITAAGIDVVGQVPPNGELRQRVAPIDRIFPYKLQLTPRLLVPPPDITITVDPREPGLGPQARRRRRTVEEIADRLTSLLPTPSRPK